MNSRTIIITILVVAFAGIIFWNGCGKMEGDPIGNQPPNVRFINVPVNGDTFNYAPIVYWIGDDPDGFVEYYSYIDDTTEASRIDPEGFIENVDPSRWVDTVATEATIYLLTDEGDTTEHTFFIRATDDDGTHSEFDRTQHVRTYYRTNLAPYTPEIKWEAWPDDSFSTGNTVPDTLFCIDTTTTNWGGIGFIWRARDPDDRELNIIPLEFRFILVDEDSNLVEQWSMDEEEYDNVQNLTVYNLETGWYTLWVWSRDDGFTLCHEPGYISFYVIKPNFLDPDNARHILLYDETKNVGTIGNWDGLLIDEFYRNLLDSIPQELLIPQARFTMDDVDVIFWDNSDLNNPLPYSLIHYYKLVIMYDEDRENSSGFTGELNYRNSILSDYMDIGGNVWIIGRRMLVGSFGLSEGPIPQADMPSILLNYFGVSGGIGANWPSYGQPEFVGAFPASQDFPILEIDTLKLPPPPFPSNGAVSEVDVVSRRISSIPSFFNFTFTSYYFNSIYTSEQDTVIGENSTVLDTLTGWPQPTETQCFIQTENSGLIEVYRVENVTKGVEGEVIWILTDVVNVSYDVGDPWEASDVLSVDYRFNPHSSSEFHLQPCGTFKISMDNDFNFLYRSAFMTFPLYPLDNSQGQVRDMFMVMLYLFFSPYL